MTPEEITIEDLDEFAMADGAYTWWAYGPNGRVWSIVWQPYREIDNMRAWPFPNHPTEFWGHARDIENAREQAVDMARLIKAGNKR